MYTPSSTAFLRQTRGGFEFVEYDNNAFPYPQTIGRTANSIVGLGNADESMIDTIFIMPNKETDPDATLMIVVDEKEPSTDPKTYQYVYVGNINDLPSDVLTEESIVNDLSTGGTDKPLSAEQGRILNSHVNYTTCGSSAADEVKLISDDGFELSTHLRLLVLMTNTNTHATPKFNINNTGVKDVWYNGSVASDINTWSASEVLDVYYDGGKYVATTHGGAQFSTGERVSDVGIDDVPTAGSDNLVKSGGVHAKVSQLDQKVDDFIIDVNGIHKEIDVASVVSTDCYVDSSNSWLVNNTYQHGVYFRVVKGATYNITANSSDVALIAIFKSKPVAGQSVVFATGESGRRSIAASGTLTIEMPSDAVYLWVGTQSYANNLAPSSIICDKEGEIETLSADIEALSTDVETLSTDFYDLKDGRHLGNATIIPYFMESTLVWQYYPTDGKCEYMACKPGSIIKITANANKKAVFAFVTRLPETSERQIPIPFCEGTSRQVINEGQSLTVTAPADAKYLVCNTTYYGNDYTPASVILLNEEDGVWEAIAKCPKESGVFANPNSWERGSISETTGKMLASNIDKNYDRTLRTKNYIRCASFNYTPRSGETLTVYEYDNEFGFVGSSEVTQEYTRQEGVEFIKLTLFKAVMGNEVSVTLTGGEISSADGTATETSSASLYAHTDFLDLDDMPFDEAWFDLDGFIAYFYDSSYNYIKPDGVVMRFSDWYGIYTNVYSIKSIPFGKHITTTKYCRICLQNKNGAPALAENYDIRWTSGYASLTTPEISFFGYEEIKNEYLGEIVDDNAYTFLFDVKPTSGYSVSVAESQVTPPIEYYNQKIYFGALKLILPPNYTPVGVGTKLIIWCQGSGDYTQLPEQKLSNTPNYVANMEYWIKSGYAIMSVWVGTTKYNTNNSDINGKPSDIASYESAYKWVIEHFNIDESGCYVSAKSMGGVGALGLMYSNIPIKAADIFAPALNPFYQQLGYGIVSRNNFITDLHLDDCEPLITNTSPASPMSKTDFNTLMITNKFKMQGHNAYFSGVTNKTFEQLVALDIYQSGAYDDVIKVCKAPIRIHIAADDTTVMYQQSLNVIKAIKNSGCVAEIRTLPAGCAAPHHATDSDPSALKVASIVTKLGYTLTDIALAYVEAVDWFDNYK